MAFVEVIIAKHRCKAWTHGRDRLLPSCLSGPNIKKEESSAPVPPSKIVIGVSLTTDVSSDLSLAIGNRRGGRQHPFVPLCGADWNLVTESQ